MAKSFDITRLTEVRARIGINNWKPCKSPMGTDSCYEHPIRKESQQLYDRSNGLEGERHVAFCFKKGDYEMYKEKKLRQEHQYKNSIVDVDGSSPCGSLCSSSCSHNTNSIFSDAEQQIFANERLIHEYKQRIRRQERRVDSLYSELNRTQRMVQQTTRSQIDLVTSRCTVQRKKSRPKKEEPFPPTRDSSAILKSAMFFALLIRLMGGSSDCLMITVFGWWVTEAFSF